MDPMLLAADDEARAKGTLNLRELRRILALVRPYAGKLAFGLVFTVLFAALNTLSIVGAFPVFATLLEREGFAGWIDRTTAGERCGVEFAVPDDDDRVVVLETNKRARGDKARPLHAGDVVIDPAGRPIGEWLHDVARADETAVMDVVRQRGGQRENVQVTAAAPDLKHRALLKVASFIPPDAQTDQGKLNLLVRLLVILALTVLVSNVCRFFGEVFIATAVLRSLMDLRATLYERTLHLPMAFFARQPTADLVTRFVQDIQEIQRGLMTFFGKFIREPLRASLILASALILDWRITLTMVVVAPLTLAVFLAVGRSVKHANKKLLRLYGDMIGALTASLQNLRVVKAFTAEPHERDRLTRVDWRMFRRQLTLARLQAFVSPMIETLAVFAASIVTVWLASRVLSNEISLSKFVMLGFVLANLFDPLRKLTDVWVRIQRSTAGAERIFQVIDLPGEVDANSGSVVAGPLTDSIELADVTFRYPGAETPALRDVDLVIRKGETIALVGPNGSGKTTLASMLPRLLVPQTGRILYDGTDLADFELRSIRRQISIVTQEAIVFAGTPIENIAYGDASPDRARVEVAARRAYADEFIRNIPGGYEAALGERGTTLSGGQCQRLAIARAIYRDAPILIFDEATSQIDSESELKIQTALRELALGRTTIVIAHRLSTIQFAQRIVVMDAGQIVDTGTHKQLLARCDLYRTLCQTQLLAEPAETTV